MDQPITPRQIKFIEALVKMMNIPIDDLNADIARTYSKRTVYELDRHEATAYIDRLQSRLQSRRPASELAT